MLRSRRPARRRRSEEAIVAAVRLDNFLTFITAPPLTMICTAIAPGGFS